MQACRDLYAAGVMWRLDGAFQHIELLHDGAVLARFTSLKKFLAFRKGGAGGLLAPGLTAPIKERIWKQHDYLRRRSLRGAGSA